MNGYVNGQTVALGHNFAAEADWIKNLTVKVKNISGKPISSIRMSFTVADTKFGFTLEYGSALSTRVSTKVEKSLLPDEELELSLSEASYLSTHNFIARGTGSADIKKILIGPTTVKFDDGTIWIGTKLPPAKVWRALWKNLTTQLAIHRRFNPLPEQKQRSEVSQSACFREVKVR